MKAISPALPMNPPSRQSNGVDASAADEAFSALIAAVIGAPVTPSAPPAQSTPSASSAVSSVSSRSTLHTDTSDDARPDVAASRSTRADHDAAATTTDQSDAAKPSDQAKSPGPTKPLAEDHSAGELEHGSSLSTAPQSTPAPPIVKDAPKVPAGLEKAAAALAQALATSGGEPAKPAAVTGVPATTTQAPSILKPGTALTEGQLPAQLVAAVTAVQAPASNVPAIGPTDVNPEPELGPKSGDKPGGTAVTLDAKQPTQVASTIPPKIDGPQADAPALLATPQPALAETSSDAKSSAAGAPVVTSTGYHSKPTEAQQGAQDLHTPAAGAPHFDAQLAAQAATQATQPTPVSPVQQAQPAYVSGMLSQQIVQVVAPLRTAKDGDYTLSLQLHPADLGAVTVRVEVQQGVLSVHMSAEHAHGHEVLNQSLSDLRSQLQTSGVRTGDIIVAAKQSLMPQQHEQQQHTGGRHQHEAPTYDDAGGDRRPADRPSRQPQQADDDTLDVRI